MERFKTPTARPIDEEPQPVECWQFIGRHLYHDPPEGMEVDPEITVDAMVERLGRGGADDIDAELRVFLYSRGAALATEAERKISRDPDNAEYVELCMTKAAYDFSRNYKETVMGALTFDMGEEIIRADPQHVIERPTGSETFQVTLADWYGTAAASVSRRREDSTLWWHFQHAIDLTRTVVLEYPDVTRSQLAWDMRDPQRWLAESFMNAEPFVSDLLISAAIGHARHHPNDITPGALTAAAKGWLPHLIAMKDSFYGTQDAATLGPELNKRWRQTKQAPDLRLLDALQRFEEGDMASWEAAVRDYASAPLMQLAEPRPLYASLENGTQKKTGSCPARFHFTAEVPPEHSHFPGSSGQSETAAAALLFQSSLNVAAKSIFRQPECLAAIAHAADLLGYA